MERLKSVNFSSNLLVANKELAAGSFNWVKTYTGSNGTTTDVVDVIALDCESVEEIPATLKRLISELEESKKSHPESLENIKHNIDYLQQRCEEINDGMHKHDVPQGLLEVIKYDFHKNKVTAEKMVYLSGVTFMQ